MSWYEQGAFACWFFQKLHVAKCKKYIMIDL